jgi:hypothetical protein
VPFGFLAGFTTLEYIWERLEPPSSRSADSRHIYDCVICHYKNSSCARV